MSRTVPTIVGLGELIWDLLPGGKQLGGAPTNFAYVSRLLGDESIVASRTGADELGREASARLARMGISTGHLQHDAQHPTGTVGVHVDAQGEAIFAVNGNSAWDYLEWTPQWEELAARTDAVCFGTLGQRAPGARATIKRFLDAMRADSLRIFDVNLRHSFFDAHLLADSLQSASIFKLNCAELPLVAAMLKLEDADERTLANQIRQDFNLELVAITRGARGSLLVSAAESIEHAGFQVEVADTIGAGDAFAAVLSHGWLRRAPLTKISEAANRMGAWVATQIGATPEIAPGAFESLLENFMSAS